MTRSMRQNDGLITLRQLREAGFAEMEVRGLVAHGDLRRLHRGVYVDGRARVTDHAHMRASLLALGARDPWLSGRAAAMGWELEPVSLPYLEVTVVARATPRPRPGLIIRSVRTAPHPSEIRNRNRLRLSSVPRLLVESAAAGADGERLHGLVERAVRRNLLDIPDLAATLRRNLGRAGTRAVIGTCEEYLPHTDRKSGLERAFDRWAAKHPEIPPPERDIHLGPWEIDCYWPDQGVVLELDGRPYHTVVEDMDRDRRKDVWLQLHGLLLMRVTDSRFKRDKGGVHRDLMALLALGGSRRLVSAA